jgi:phosphatidylethanolamine-binding protein (PEBP) family uncharacterized protein
MAWTKGPEGTKSYVVIMQGYLGGVNEKVSGTSIHFTLINVPANVTKLDAGMTTPRRAACTASTFTVRTSPMPARTHTVSPSMSITCRCSPSTPFCRATRR